MMGGSSTAWDFFIGKTSKRGYVAMLSFYEKIAPHLNPANGGTVYSLSRFFIGKTLTYP
jgi:hypothetical protein